MIPDLEYLLGRWHATAENPETGQSFALDCTVERVLKDRWYRGTGVAAALGLEIHDLWGVDPVSGEIVRTIFDSTGTFGTVRARGWAGDVLVLQGDAATAGGRVTVRETITRRGADELDAVWEALADGVWKPYSVETLRRRG